MAIMNEIKDRISGIKDIMKITNAMYLISSSKLKKARANWEAMQPYFDNIQATVHHVLEHTEEFSHPYFDNGKDKPDDQKKYGYIVVSGDKGMCGSYNHNIVKFAQAEIAKHENAAIFAVGTAGRIHFERIGANVDVEFLYTVQDPTFEKAKMIADTITEHYLKGRLDEVYIIYTRIERGAEVPKIVKMFPLERHRFEEGDPAKERYMTTRFEPSPHAVIDTVGPIVARGLIYGVLTAAYCAEHNARMSAMDASTTSARDMITQLSLEYNRARQAAITQEISEIVGGAKSLSQKKA